MIIVKTSPYHLQEKRYIINVILSDFLGQSVEIIPNEDDMTQGWYHLQCPDGGVIKIPDILFAHPDHYAAADRVFPKNIKGDDQDIDIFGLAFFMMSRVEEVMNPSRDGHGRFAAKDSYAGKNGFLSQPIVDIYTEKLWDRLSRVCPSLTRPRSQYRLNVTCDVDWPYNATHHHFYRSLKSSIAQVVKQGRIFGAMETMGAYGLTRLNPHREDSFSQAVEWMMDVNEAQGNVMTFFFIPLKTHAKRDVCADLYHPLTRRLIHQIHERGHQIGMHPGYGCMDNPDLLSRSADLFFKAMEDFGIQQKEWGCRMHYLRFNVGITPQGLAQAGFDYDSSMGYADQAGFRCGTAKDFPIYDVVSKQAMTLRERPLIAMERTIISDLYEGLGHTPQTVQRFQQLKAECQNYHGLYTVLWHNDHLISEDDKTIYTDIIKHDA